MKKFWIIGLIALAGCNPTSKVTELEGQQVYFAYDSARVSPEAKQDLLKQSLYMKNNKDANVLIEGHCDERGSTEYNLALGSLRSGNAAHVLIADGVESTRIKTTSYGKERPLYLGTGEEVWSKNRNATSREVK